MLRKAMRLVANMLEQPERKGMSAELERLVAIRDENLLVPLGQ